MRDVFTVQVDRLISPFPEGVMLALFDEYVQKVHYERYRERLFRIPAGCTLSEIKINNAPRMQSISVAAPNDKLVTLALSQAGLLSLPNSLLNLHKLVYLFVQDGALRTVSLEPLANCEKLDVLLLSSNNVTQLVVSKDPDLFVPIKDLLLAQNQLEYIDGEFFTPLRNLIFLSLEENRLQRIGGPLVSFPKLSYLRFEKNQMTYLNVSSWLAPRLLEISLDYNNFTQLPIGLERLPSLAGLLLSYNYLSAIDLRRLESWPKLERIDLSNNLIQNVRISFPGRVSLPLVNSVNLANNNISQLEFARWNMPMLSSLTLAFNRLERLPDLFQLFPKLGRVIAFRNLFRCDGLRPLEQYLALNRLTVDTTAYGMPCTTSSSFTVYTGRVICCEE
uniref:Leucine rich immune protein (Coil-less) n=1 Tax=Anopheles atroparvus TaxID=41427 RepID=A0A182IJD9_ANOAO